MAKREESGEANGNAQLLGLLQDIMRRRKVRAKPLIMSFYGDCVVSRGGSTWLSSIVAVCNMMGIDDHLTRASALRLVYDGWLSNHRSGRMSYYSMSESYAKTYLDFQSRVYSDPTDLRQKDWLLLVLTGNFAGRKERRSIIDELIWYGFGPVEPRLFLHASLPHETAHRAIQHIDGGETALLTQFHYGSVPWETLANLVSKAWDLKQLTQGYQSFLDNFGAVQRWLLGNGASTTPSDALAIRLLLIHEYRRIALRDPHLPKEFTGLAWPGNDAFALMKDLYWSVFERSETYLDQILATPDGVAPPLDRTTAQRFGGVRQ